MGRRAAITDGQVRELHAQGLDQYGIAARLGVTQPTISKRLGRLGLRSPGDVCKQGHPLKPENLDPHLLRLGKRRCKTCARATARTWKERKRREAGVPRRGTTGRDPLVQKRMDEATRRARKRDSFVEKVDPQVVWERDEGVCGICGEAADRADWHLDHIVPLARGGAHSYANTQVSHPACNLRKGAS